MVDPRTPTGPDRRAVLDVAAVPGGWTESLGPRRAWEIGRLADRLLTIVSLYAAGVPLDEISRRLGCWSAWSVERALDAACDCIAAQLNRRRAPGDRLTSEG